MRSLTWPSRTYVLTLALYLAAAWLAMAVLSRVIRSRTAARAVAWIGWIYVAALILGVTDEVAAFLEGMAVTIGSFRFSVLLAVKAVLLLTVTIWVKKKLDPKYGEPDPWKGSDDDDNTTN